MNLEKELIGKGYPVKNADDNSILVKENNQPNISNVKNNG